MGIAGMGTSGQRGAQREDHREIGGLIFAGILVVLPVIAAPFAEKRTRIP